MEDAAPAPRPLSTRQIPRLLRDDEGDDLLTPLVQSRRPSRQYVSISPPPSDSLSLAMSYPPPTEALPVFTNPWPRRPSCSDTRSSTSPGSRSTTREQAGPSAPKVPRVPLLHVRDESPSGAAREASLSMVSEDTVTRLPLTPFPPWTSNADREGRQARDEAGACRCDDGRRSTRSIRRSVSFMHASVLAAQFLAFMGLFCVWVDVAVREAASHSGFWVKLWMYFQPALGVLCLFTLSMMLVLEARGLSDGAFWGVEAVVLAVGGGAGFCVVWWAFGQGSRVVIGAAVGTAVMMLGVGMFGFVRAAVVLVVAQGEAACRA
ncbi:peroxisomal membrane protein PEX31 [Metarhizium album ARSEF 1941]|uniref:Peroxisomal membrane protein PEX31 n=1 Tax=Metarhizium album (strain ARSEF 1941) TaxID=1081103 RepID=A0A0B2X7Y6_METAS|nr:peroxisomal membrane protein PEX31 [Metarhizium album ARSEF 1941]KHO01620.1 peroxisomal membrane protein PEX31 [Metarhizium album ARSEF 1941]